MKERKPMGKKTPPGVVDAVVKELALVPANEKGRIQDIVQRFDLTEEVVKSIQQRKKGTINEIRELIAERGFDVATLSLARINEKLLDDEEMKLTPLRDLALTHSKVVDASVTALEGHAPTIQKIDFTSIQVRESRLEAWDAKMAERKAQSELRISKSVDAEIVG